MWSAALLILTALACITHGAKMQQQLPVKCPAIGDYPEEVVKVLTPQESNFRFVRRRWDNVGLGHRMEVHNIGLRMAIENNLTMSECPLGLGHGPFLWNPETFFGFGVGLISTADIDKALTKRTLNVPKLTRITWPDDASYGKHSMSWSKKFTEFVKLSPQPNVLFEIAGPQVFPDQDWDYRVTGNWYRSKYEAAESERQAMMKGHLLYESSSVNVAVHVRRGDAFHMTGAMKSDDYYATIINQVVARIRLTMPEATVAVHVFTDGSAGLDRQHTNTPPTYVDETGKAVDFPSKVTVCNDCVKMHIKTDALVSFHHFLLADVFISGSSMFSNFAGQISRNVHISSSGVRSQSLRGRIPATLEGIFDTALFNAKWAAYVACNAHQRPLWPSYVEPTLHAEL